MVVDTLLVNNWVGREEHKTSLKQHSILREIKTPTTGREQKHNKENSFIILTLWATCIVFG